MAQTPEQYARWRATNKEKLREYMRNYYKERKKQLCDYQKEYREWLFNAIEYLKE
jgi:hypothetical protein